MATTAIGDVHGNFEALDDLLRTLQPELDASDVVVFLGDYIDRGPDTRLCIDRILASKSSVGPRSSACWEITTIRSYSQDAAHAPAAAIAKDRGALYRDDCALPYNLFFESVPRAHLQWLERLRLSHHTADCFCSHGGVDPDEKEIARQGRYSLIWGGTGFPERYDGADTVVYGHHNNASLNAENWPMPAIAGRTIGEARKENGRR